jgi:hypothetical protein
VTEGYTVSAEKLRILGDGDENRGRLVLRMMLADEKAPKRHVGPTDRPASVRIATEADEAALFAHLLKDLEENAEAIAPIDDKRVLEQIRIGTTRQGSIIGVIDGPGGGIIGSICLAGVPWWWSTRLHAMEVWTFVDPAYRTGEHAAALLEFAKWASDELSRTMGYQAYSVIGVLGPHRTKSKVRMYGRKATQIGATFIYPSPPE